MQLDDAGMEYGVEGVTVSPTVQRAVAPSGEVYVPVYRWAKVEIEPPGCGYHPGG